MVMFWVRVRVRVRVKVKIRYGVSVMVRFRVKVRASDSVVVSSYYFLSGSLTVGQSVRVLELADVSNVELMRSIKDD